MNGIVFRSCFDPVSILFRRDGTPRCRTGANQLDWFDFQIFPVCDMGGFIMAAVGRLILTVMAGSILIPASADAFLIGEWPISLSTDPI